MPSDNCKFHKRGHCKAKYFCKSNHDIKICPQNQFCNKKELCELRHVKNCPKFPFCGFENTQGDFIFSKNCSYFHPPPIPPLFHHPPPIPPLFPRMHYCRVEHVGKGRELEYESRSKVIGRWKFNSPNNGSFQFSKTLFNLV